MPSLSRRTRPGPNSNRMYTVIKAESPRQKRAFFSLSRACGYSRDEAEYLRLFCRPENASYFIALKDGRPKARILVWKDAAYQRNTGRRTAFFAFLDGDENAFALLLEAAQNAYPDAEALTGPVPPDGSGLFTGQCDRPCGTDRGAFTGPGDAGQAQALLEAGFAPCMTEACFEIAVPAVNPYRAYAGRLSARFGIRVQKARFGLFGDGLSRAAYELAGAWQSETALQAGRIRRYISPRFSFVALDGNGRALGYVMTLRGRPLLRVTTLITKDVPFRPAVTLLLLDALCESLIQSGITRAEASVIDVNNRPSVRLTQGTGARETRKYVRYYKELT